jgi:membrane protease YdiL (CAAX protease family)
MVAGGSAALYCRGFILQTLVNFAPHLAPLHLLASSLQFAIAHYASATSMLTFTVTGLLLGTSYLQSGRNLLVPITAHALVNLGGLVYIVMQP